MNECPCKIARKRTQPLPGRVKRKKRRHLSFTVALRELALLVVALDVANMAYWYLAPWPIYRIVAFVVIFVLWSNVASETARGKTKQAWDKLNTMSTQAVHAAGHPRKHHQTAMVKFERDQDTTGYLESIKKEHYEDIKTIRLYDTVPIDISNCRVLHSSETAPVR